MTSWMRWKLSKRELIALGIFAVFYVLFGIVLTFNQERIVYQPSAQDFHTCAGFADAQKVVHGDTRMYVQEGERGMVVFYHGNGGSACDRAFIAQEIATAGYGYIIPEYAGYSNDTEPPNGNPVGPEHAAANELENEGANDQAQAAPLPTAPDESQPATHAEYERFAVSLGASRDDVADDLAKAGFIKSKTGFSLAFTTSGGGDIAPGAYRLAKTMSAFEVADALRREPYMKWVVIQEGLRKEEIAEKLAATLDWNESEKSQWLAATEVRTEHVEGVYFPDTYLIPVDEAPEEVAARLVAKFNEQFASHLAQFNAQNIRWTTGLTFASLIQREASNDAEMPLIAGILWNRLDEGMHLNVDATLQYARGNTGSGWWAPITVAEKELDSPFNTYKYRGLPPHPIANPGIPAIGATLNPAETDCFYYLHDSDRNIHCAETYEEHQENIEEYL